jgi:surface protein
MFKLISIDLSYFDTKNVQDFAYMFRGCSKLKLLNISHFNTFLFLNKGLCVNIKLDKKKLKN